MSNPEMPPQPPSAPVASDAAEVHSEPIAPPVEAPHNGKPSASVDVGAAANSDAAAQDDSGEQEDAGAPEADDGEKAHGQDSAAASTAGGEKKRRRRRRKKKPAAAAGTEGAEPASTEEGTEVESADATSESAGEVPRVEKRDRKKERKHAGPPRERPPVNGGDIVFGKILEITDEAILIDIPGKAHAIFDRREMLLLDDDDSSKAAVAQVTPEPQDVARERQEVAGEQGAVAADGTETETGEHALATDETGVTDGANGAVATHVEAAAVEAPPVEAQRQLETAAPSDPPKEPKVPRVILEIGADFIGVVHNDGARGGLVVLTHHPNRAEKTKPLVEKAFQEKTTILGLVSGVIKGGVEVDVGGLRAFAPGSHVDMRMGADLSHLVAQRLPFFVTQYAKRGRDVVLSRKAIIEEEAKKARTDALARLKVGEEIDGIVRSVVAFGAFIDVGGLEGLVPLQEMSHNRADHPSDVFKAGEPTRVRVTKIDDRGKVWLSRKATIPDPWQEVAEKYAHGTRHTGKVVRLQPFGAFIELEPGVDGLIHTQDLSIKWVENPGDVVKIGDPIEVVVAHVDSANHKIALHPAPQGDAANEAPQKVVPHKPVKARIVTIESGGLVVRILGVTGRNARGYITSAGTGTPRGTELRKAFKVGQDIEAKVIEMDPRRGESKLSIKALSEEQERSAYQQYRQQLKAEARFTLADLLTKKGSPR
jgi:small subunit ribosomal protein S1